MSDNRYSYGQDEHEDNSLGASANLAALNAFHNAWQALNNAEIGKTKKFLGVVSMDAGIVDILDGFYNVGADWVATTVRPQIRGIVEKKRL